MTLRARLTFWIAAAVGIAVALGAVFAYQFARDEAIAEVDSFLRERGPVAGLIGSLDELRSPFGFGRRQGSGPGPLGEVVRSDAIAQFVDSSGTIIAFDPDAVILPVDRRDLALAESRGPDLIRDVTADGVHYRVLTRHLGAGLAIQVARDMSGTDAILAGLRLKLILLTLGGVLVAAGVGWVVSRRGLQPVGDLTRAASHVAATHELDQRIEVDRSDELGQLAESFNSMLTALEEARASQQRLVADASHELRTPLTSLRTNIELLSRDVVGESDRQELLDDVHSELQELSHLMTELVDLATIGRDEEPMIEVDLAELVLQAVERVRRRYGVSVEATLEPTIVRGRPSNLSRAVSNLLENAAKWGSGDGAVEVTLRNAAVTVRDHGPGIPEPDLSRIFERFYRSPEARSLPGSGLGLSIVAAVAADHGGATFARNAPDGGAIVGFTVATSVE